MATVRNAKSKNNNTNLAARLSVLANGGTKFLDMLDEDGFYIDPDGRNSILGKNDNDFEYAFTGKHHDYHCKFHKYWELSKHPDGLKGTGKAVREQIFCNI